MWYGLGKKDIPILPNKQQKKKSQTKKKKNPAYSSDPVN